MVRYDPFDLSLVEVWYKGEKKKMVSPANIGEFNRNVKSRLRNWKKPASRNCYVCLPAKARKG